MEQNDVLNLLHTRRSTLAKDLSEPGPNNDQLNAILEAGHRVPDHGKLGPWRFILFKEDARLEFGKILAEVFVSHNKDASEAQIQFEQERFNRAPCIIAVVSSPVLDSKIPVWEQQLAAGAVCQNILLSASAIGFGAQWLTEWYAYDQKVLRVLKLNEHEKIAGFIYIGTKQKTPTERKRPTLEERVLNWRT